jgi:deoxyribonuclease V
MERGERIGTALKTRAGSKPIYVSVGHRISLAQAAKLVLKCSDGRYRLPEPTRLAHIEVNAFRRFSEGPG